MSFRWSEETTLKFVSKYVEHECLWNIKSPHYKNKQIKQSAYLDLENTMNISGFGEKEIKLKIKNIRSTYSQELKKIKDTKNSGAGTDMVYIPSVKWFSVLDAVLRNLTSTLTQSESNLASNSSHTDDTDTIQYTEQNSTVVDTFREPTPPRGGGPPTKKKKIAQLSNMVSQLKEIADSTNSTVEENEFEIFGKHVGLQLKSLPILLALEAQEHIQLYINRIRRQYLQNATAQNRITTTSQSSYTTGSPYSDSSMYYNYNNIDNSEEQATENISSSILPTDHSEHVADYQLSSNMFPSGHINDNETPSNVTITSKDLISTAMNNANVDNQ